MGGSDSTLLTPKVETRISAFLEEAHFLLPSGLSPSVTTIVNSKKKKNILCGPQGVWEEPTFKLQAVLIWG